MIQSLLNRYINVRVVLFIHLNLNPTEMKPKRPEIQNQMFGCESAVQHERINKMGCICTLVTEKHYGIKKT